MKHVLKAPFSLVAAAAILAGCGSSSLPQAGGTTTAPAGAAATSDSMAGMAMSEARPSADPTGSHSSASSKSAAGPTATQAMVCGDEIKGDVRKILQLAKQPSTQSSFAENIFTCTYNLSFGKMRLSVQHSASDAAGLRYLTGRRASVGAGQRLQGLTDNAYGTGTGVVLVLKDNEILEVDTTALPKVFGDQQQKRTDLAYEIASDVLGCWTGDDGS